MITHDLLPQGRDAGTRATWTLPVGREDEDRLEVEGTFLGVGSTHRDRHPHRPLTEYVSASDEKCAACRWFEIRLFRVEEDADRPLTPATDPRPATPAPPDAVVTFGPAFASPGDDLPRQRTPEQRDQPGQSGRPSQPGRTHYVVHFTGASVVPGEVDFYRAQEAWSPHELIELFTVRSGGRPGEVPRQPFLTRPGAQVLAQAAHYDAPLDDAWVNRAIS